MAAPLSNAELDGLEREIASTGYLDGTEGRALIAEVRESRRFAVLCHRAVQGLQKMAAIAVETEQLRRQIEADGPSHADDSDSLLSE